MARHRQLRPELGRGRKAAAVSGAARAMAGDARLAEHRLEMQLALCPSAAFGQGPHEVDALREMAYGFRSGRAPEGALASALPVVRGALRQARLSEVMGEQLRLGLDHVRPPLFQHLAMRACSFCRVPRSRLA